MTDKLSPVSCSQTTMKVLLLSDNRQFLRMRFVALRARDRDKERKVAENCQTCQCDKHTHCCWIQHSKRGQPRYRISSGSNRECELLYKYKHRVPLFEVNSCTSNPGLLHCASVFYIAILNPDSVNSKMGGMKWKCAHSFTQSASAWCTGVKATLSTYRLTCGHCLSINCRPVRVDN